MAGGLPIPLPNILTEDMTGVEFPDPYYQWKRMAERLVAKAAAGSQFSYSIVRPALVYGPNAEWLTGMLKLIKAAGRYLVPLPEAGKALLGTVHVEDAANTIAMSGWSDQAQNQVIHAVDSGRTTYADWFYEIAKNAGWNVNVRRIPKGVVLSLARTVDALTSVAGVHYGAYLWAQVLSEGCAYSNERMKKIIGPLSYPTIREGIPGMMKWFDAVHP
jgi:nucleoside-diphosphate-sugar epimerase